MKQSLNSYNTSSYTASKLKMADEKKDKLLNTINRLSNLSYVKGSREGDAELRERVKDLAGEIEEYYKTIRIFASGKGGDAEAFPDILVFFNERYLENNTLVTKLDLLKKEVERQKQPDHEHSGRGRKVNIHAEDLEKTLRDWEKIYLYNAEPQLREFLVDVNDIVLYMRIYDAFDQLITGGDVFARSGTNYRGFKNSIAYFVEIHIKLARTAFGKSGLKEVINHTLQVMGFRNSILHTRNINLEKYDEVLSEIIREGNLMEYVKKYSVSSKVAVDAIRSFEKKQRGDLEDPKDLKKVLEDLCYLDDPEQGRKTNIGVSVSGLAKNDKERYLFHSPGTFNISLKFVSEYMRNSLILVVDWLSKELQKTQGAAKLLGSLYECVPLIKEFITIYQTALDVSAQKSNQTKTTVMSSEKHYISRNIAGNLVQSIKGNCDAVRSALVDSTYNVRSSSFDKSGVLGKKIDIIKESCFDSFNRISKGLSEIDRV